MRRTIHLQHRLRVLILALAVVFAVVPAASQARHAPDDFGRPQQAATLAFTVGDELDARVGPKYVALPHPPDVGAPDAPAAEADPTSGFPYWSVLLPLAAALAVVAVLLARRRASRGPEVGTVTTAE
jgi:hypothetical protein